MLTTKQAGQPVSKEQPHRASPDVLNPMEALKRSLAGSSKSRQAAAVGDKPAEKIKAKRPKKRIEGQREMQVPIAENPPAKPVAAAKIGSTNVTPSLSGLAWEWHIHLHNLSANRYDGPVCGRSIWQPNQRDGN